jgi:hypothetical protein
MPNTLTINFAETTPDPQGGYRVTYWPTNSPASATVITPNPTSSPVVITGLNGTAYSGSVEAVCGGGVFSTPALFNATAGSSGAATLAIGNACSGGYGDYNLTGTVGNVVRVRLQITGGMVPTSTAWVFATMTSASPSFNAIASSGCFEPGSTSGVSLDIYKNITIPSGGVVNIDTSIFVNNSSPSLISATLSIVSVNGGNNTTTGNTSISPVCVAQASGQSCPGANYMGD